MLREVQIRSAKPAERPYKLVDGGGLFLLVQPNGSKLWRLRYTRDGRETMRSLGKYPAVTLADARERARSGPVVRVEAVTFEWVARRWHENRKAGLVEAHHQRVLARMERDVFPQIGALPVTGITAPQLREMIAKVEKRGALDISRRIHQMAGQVFRFAIANGWAVADPSAGLKGALKPRPRVEHMARVALTGLPDLVRKIDRYDGDPATRAAMLFTLLTWARTGEVRGATWDEIEGEGLWRIPAERMKMGREHLVPLSPQAQEVLAEARTWRRGRFVFPGDLRRKEGNLSQNAMIGACYRLGFRGRQTIHGFRSLASTWANEAGYNRDWIELSLAHVEGGVRAAYNAATCLPQRRQMLGDWGKMVWSYRASGDVVEELFG